MFIRQLCMCVCVSRLPKDQDCHELWSRMMKKALRERMARPSDDHSTAVDTRNSTFAKNTAPAAAAHSVSTAVSSHHSSSMNHKSTVAGSSSVLSSDLNVAAVLGQRRSWTGLGVSSQHVTAAGSHVHSSSSSSSSLHANDSSYSNLTQRPAVTRHFDLRHVASGSSHAHAPTTNHQ